MRIILYTGKGGVGKTSVAAATAAKIAEGGKKVLIISTDAAHSLSDSFDTKLCCEPKNICTNLYGMELDSTVENEKIWGNLKRYLEKLIIFNNESSIESEELLVLPGFEELISLCRIKDIYDENNYDVLIVDCAPTGETMSLLKSPEVFKNVMETIFPMKRKAAKIAGPVVECTMKIPMPNDNTFEDIQRIYNKIKDLHQIMTDKDHVSIRIVTTPEKIVVKEAKRSFSYLHLFDYNVDGIIVNKIFPDESLKGYFDLYGTTQKQCLVEIRDSFKNLPIFYFNLMNKELRKLENLKEAGRIIYDGVNPEDILFKEKIFEIEKEEEKYVLIINMPFINKEELQLSEKGNEVYISVKNETRNFVLPKILQNKGITGAKYENSTLKIYF